MAIEQEIDTFRDDNQDNQDTIGMHPITDDVIQNFSEKKAEDKKEKTIVDFEEQKPKTKKKKLNISFWKIILIVFCVLTVGALMFGIWNRWFRFDDHKSLISNWQVANSNSVVEINENNIVLDKNAIFEYHIDSFAKTISYKLGNMEGVSHYRFSWDRNQIAFIENGSTNAFLSIFDDLAWFWDSSTCDMNGIELSPAYTKSNKNEVNTENTGLEDIFKKGENNSILLDRVSTKK